MGSKTVDFRASLVFYSKWHFNEFRMVKIDIEQIYYALEMFLVATMHTDTGTGKSRIQPYPPSLQHNQFTVETDRRVIV